MTQYNMTKLLVENDTSFLTFTQQVNNVLVAGFLGDIFLIGIFLVIFIGTIFSTNDASKALISSCFVCFVLSLSLVALSLAHVLAIFISLAGLAAGLAMSFKN